MYISPNDPSEGYDAFTWDDACYTCPDPRKCACEHNAYRKLED